MSSKPTTTTTRADEQLVFNTRLVEPLLKFFEASHGREALEDAVRASGLTMEQLADPDLWISAGAVNRLNRLLVDRSGNPMLTYEAGLAMISPEYAGPTYYVIRALGSPKLVYSQLPALAKPLTKITNWDIQELSRSHAVVRFEIAEGHSDDELFCLNRQGALVGIPKGLGLPPARVEHPKCIHRGDPYCEYHVSWQAPDLTLRIAGVVALLGAAAILIAVITGGLPRDALIALPGILALWSTYATWSFWSLAQKGSASAVEQVRTTQRQMDADYQRYRDLATITSIDQLTREHTQVDTLIGTALEEVTRTLGYQRAVFMTLDAADGVLRYADSVGYPEALIPTVSRWEAALEHPSDDQRFLGNIARQREGTLVVDLTAYRAVVSERTRQLLDTLGTQAFMAMPVVVRDEVIGLVVVEHAGQGKPLTKHDLELLGRLAHMLGLALDNARKVQDLQQRRRELEAALLLAQKYSQYLPATVVDRLREDPRLALELGGEPIRATVLFSDIKGFTQWAKDRDPTTVVSTLNRYFAAMDDVIAATGGILDKRMGDGLMVVFLHPTGMSTDVYEPPNDDAGPSPEDWPRHPACRAIDCALRMQLAVDALTADPAMADFPDLRIRIGVAHGDLVAGNLGSRHRLEYTVIGDVVNVASRLESICPPGGVITTRATQLCASDGGFVSEPFGEQELEGREGSVELVRVSRPSAPDEA